MQSFLQKLPLEQGGLQMLRIALAYLLLTGVAGVAGAAEVSRNVTVDASATEVWQVVGPYCAISDWYPGIETCTEEKIEGTVHRRLGTADGAEFLEKQLSHDAQAMSYSYAIIEGALPVKNYEATLSVSGSGPKAVLTWTSTFEPEGVTEEEAVNIVGGVYDTGLEAVKQRFGQ